MTIMHVPRLGTFSTTLAHACRIHRSRCPSDVYPLTPSQRALALDMSTTLLDILERFPKTEDASFVVDSMRQRIDRDAMEFPWLVKDSSWMLLDDVEAVLRASPKHVLGAHWYVFFLTGDTFQKYIRQSDSSYSDDEGCRINPALYALRTSFDIESRHWTDTMRAECLREIGSAYIVHGLLHEALRDVRW